MKPSLALGLFVALLLVGPLGAQQAPGINEPYKDANIEIAVWVERFETEGREVYDFRNEIVAAIGLEPGQAVADVGAGTGLFEPLLAAAVGLGGKIYAIDIAPAFVEHIAAKAAELGLGQIEARLGDERSIRLPAGSVDLVFTSDAYHHFEDYEAMLRSIHEALRPGGRFVVADYDRVEGKSAPRLLEHIRASKEQFTAEIEASGFRLVADVTADGMQETFVRIFERL